MKILGLCGSLRRNSSNGALLKAAQLFLSDGDWFDADLAALPYFDPDQQYDQTPKQVLELRRQATLADAVFIATPEYAHAMPGLLKNTLEWMFCEGHNEEKRFCCDWFGAG